MAMSEVNRMKASERMRAMHTAKKNGGLPPEVKIIDSRVSEQKRAAVNKRWESVRDDREEWLRPFKELPTHEALAYLENLRNVCEEAGGIINNRINDSSLHKECSGPGCRKSCDDRRLPNGQVMPSYISKKDFRDKNNPEIMHSFYFCSAACDNNWVRKNGGQYGGTGQ